MKADDAHTALALMNLRPARVRADKERALHLALAGRVVGGSAGGGAGLCCTPHAPQPTLRWRLDGGAAPDGLPRLPRAIITPRGDAALIGRAFSSAPSTSRSPTFTRPAPPKR